MRMDNQTTRTQQDQTETQLLLLSFTKGLILTKGWGEGGEGGKSSKSKSQKRAGKLKPHLQGGNQFKTDPFSPATVFAERKT